MQNETPRLTLERWQEMQNRQFAHFPFWLPMKMLYLFECMTPIFLNTVNALRTLGPQNGPKKLEFTTSPPKTSRAPHNEAVDARLWLWPHAPPENVVGRSRLSLAQLRRRVLQKQVRNGRPDYAVAVRESHAHVTPHPVHGWLSP
jgi:hypothetical protein